MALTAAQVYAAFISGSTFNILKPTAPINVGSWTDQTDWAALGVTTGAGDTVKTISQVIDPVGQYPYQNAGYQTDVYTSPDTTLTDLFAPNYNLFVYANGGTTPIYGTYLIMIKIQVVLASDPSNPIYTEKTFSVPLEEGITPTLSLQETDSCTQLTYTSTDVTNYGFANYTLQTIARTHTVYPPAVSGQSDVTADAAIVTLGSPDNPLWNATYEAELSVVLTYYKGYNFFITHASTSTERKVNCVNDLCGLKCCLTTLETGYNQYKTEQNFTKANDYLQKFTLCTLYYNLIQSYLLCGDTDSVPDAITTFYNTAKPYCDRNCNCGCDDEPAPATASNILQGPAGPTGPQGPIGATGATGPTGATGAAGGGVLANQFPNEVTAGTSFESVLDSKTPFILAANTLNTDGDMLKGYYEVQKVDESNTDFAFSRMTFNGNDMMLAADHPFLAGTLTALLVEFTIVRVSNTAINYYFTVNLYGQLGASSSQRVQSNAFIIDITGMSGLNLTTTAYNIDVEVLTGAGAGTVICKGFELTYFHKI